MAKKSSLLPHHERILIALDECSQPLGESCVSFAHLAQQAEVKDIRKVRRITRALARKGLAELHRGLFTEDGDLAGSGYCITASGRALVESIPQPEER